MCIPNVQHYTVIKRLLQGEWPLEDSGLFDKTHIRWFTKKSIIDMMKNLGLYTYDIASRIPNVDAARKFAKLFIPVLNELRIEPNKFLNGIASYQYVIRVGRNRPKQLSITGLMLNPQAGMNDVRMIRPLRSIASYPGVNLTLSSHKVELLPSNSNTPRIMIWQRQLLRYSDNSIDRIKQIINAGYILISEFDDDPDYWPDISKNNHLNFKGVHAVQVSTKLLKDKIMQYNPDVKSFDNCLEEIPEISNQKWLDINNGNKIKIFFGALNRRESWKHWITSLNKVISENPNSWSFEVVHDSEFYSMIKTSNKNYTPTCDYDTYLSILKSCHIALLPLENTSFNNFKSDLKFVECAGCNVASLASPTVYNSTIKNKNTGIIIEDPNEIISVLRRWDKNRGEIKQVAENALNWCKHNRLQSTQSQERLDWYYSLWDRREELTESLLIRVPELRS